MKMMNKKKKALIHLITYKKIKKNFNHNYFQNFKPFNKLTMNTYQIIYFLKEFLLKAIFFYLQLNLQQIIYEKSSTSGKNNLPNFQINDQKLFSRN